MEGPIQMKKTSKSLEKKEEEERNELVGKLGTFAVVVLC